jgi:amidase
VLLPDYKPQPMPTRLLVVTDALEALMPEATASAAAAIDALAPSFQKVEQIRLSEDGLEAWRFNAFRFIQGYEAWQSNGDWITKAKPEFGPGVAERFAAAATITEAEFAAASRLRETIRERVRGVLDANTVLCLPSAAGAAPLKGTPPDDLEPFRNATLSMCCIAGLSGLPQISLPRAMVDGAPLGISLIAQAGGDEMLLQAALDIR